MPRISSSTAPTTSKSSSIWRRIIIKFFRAERAALQKFHWHVRPTRKSSPPFLGFAPLHGRRRRVQPCDCSHRDRKNTEAEHQAPYRRERMAIYHPDIDRAKPCVADQIRHPAGPTGGERQA
jgi:hypothetical protein